MVRTKIADVISLPFVGVALPCLAFGFLVLVMGAIAHRQIGGIEK